LDHERYDQAAQMTGALSRFWYMRGHLREGRRWVELALKQVIGVSPENRAAALHGAGMLTFSQGDLTAAEAYYQDAIKLRRLTGDMRGVALLLNNLGLVLWKRGQIKQAHAMFLESAELLRPIGDENGVANALINLGIMAFEQGEWEQSAAYNIEALAFRRKINNPHAIAICLNNLGATTTGQGDFVKARELLEEGLSICRSMGFTMLIANIASLLAIVLLEQQQYDEARKLLIESLQIRHELGDVAGMSDSVGKIGILEGRVGNPRQAAQLIAMVLHFREQQGYSLDYLERNWYKAAIDDLQGKLGDTAWNEITAAGRRDDFDTTVAALLEKA
jgi:tetratricopeptide (TPR) repeat protein